MTRAQPRWVGEASRRDPVIAEHTGPACEDMANR